jgi:ribosomal protein S18 acetylase RimI-like enzyme
MNAILFKPVTAVDVHSLAMFFERNNNRETLRTFHPFPMTLQKAEEICTIEKKDRYFGAYLEDQIIGLSMLRGLDEGYEIPSFGIVMDSNYRGHGIGSGLTKYTIQQSIEMGCPAVRLSVYASNKRALKIYNDLGFVERERSGVLVQNQPDEKIIMLLKLDNVHDKKN